MKNKKTLLAIVIAILAVLVVVLAVFNRKGSQSAVEGLHIQNGGKEIVVAWEDLNEEQFEGDVTNGKGETKHSVYEGVELSKLLADNGITLEDGMTITAISGDNYSAEITAAELAESGKVYVAVVKDSEMVEGVEGGQGSCLVVFGDANSKRNVRYLAIITVE